MVSHGPIERPGDHVIAISGSGGAGAITAGSILLDAAAKSGRYGLLTRSVGPQIRGGEAAALVRLSDRPLSCGAEKFDTLIAMDWRNIDRFIAEIPLSQDSTVIADPKAGDIPDAISQSGATVVEIPLQALAAEIDNGRPNMVALGAAAALAGIPSDAIIDVIGKKLEAKGSAVIEAGIASVITGGAAAADAMPCPPAHDGTRDGAERWVISGNEAAGLGAVRGGVRFAAAYPITPATEILEWLAAGLPKLGGTLVQAEDELASINMVIGASFGGTPSLTATSGPGLALMIESLGLATASEVPVVVVDVMRGGPSTGIPTKSEQSDLNIAVYGFHGDAPHVVVAPLSVSDCVFTTSWAVHLAEAMQVPAIVLSDQFLGQARAVIDRPADVAFIGRREIAAQPANDYCRYAVTASGVSPMAIPGTAGGRYTADGLEHSPSGNPSSRGEDHAAQLDKRRNKVDGFDYGSHWADLGGDADAETAVLTWGSTAAAANEAVSATDMPVRLIAMRLLSPPQTDQLAAALAGVKRILIVDQSHSGQFQRYLRAFYDLPGETRSLHRAGPLLFGPSEILQALEEWS